MSNTKQFMILGAEEYIAYDKSDPFTRARVYSHMRNGIATSMRATPARENKYNYTEVKEKDGSMQTKWFEPPSGTVSSFYNADRVSEERSYQSEGVAVKYTVPAWRNIVRP